MSKQLKLKVLEHIDASGSMEHTEKTLRSMQAEMEGQITQIEQISGIENWVLRLLLHKLHV